MKKNKIGWKRGGRQTIGYFVGHCWIHVLNEADSTIVHFASHLKDKIEEDNNNEVSNDDNNDDKNNGHYFNNLPAPYTKWYGASITPSFI